MAKAAEKLAGYETVFITRAEMNDEGLKALHDRVKQIIGSFAGELVIEEDWGKRKLAYPIQKESRAQYSFFAYSGKAGVVAEIERNLRIHDHVLRFLSVNVEDEFEPAEYKKAREEQREAAKKREEEREARRQERMAERRDRGGYSDRPSYSERSYGEESFGGDEE